MERSFLTSRVFTPNNHYLSHIPYMIEQMGPLRFISCRASERNIKTHTRNIRSASKPSENASNNILKREVLQSCGIKESMDEQLHVTYHPDSFHCLDPNDSNAPALWEPASSFVTLGNGTTCGGLNDDFVIKALQTCYSRLVDHVVHVDLENYDVLLAKRLWLRSFVISSALYRKHLHLDIRADNFVLFETGIYTG
ncbi:hypothetical protein G6F56_013648 [Rhizopus delemar]|nr:hypothetical protein G6F56_013648 [Rhizopus delemar]